jgi:hypothetical protein
MVVSILIIVSTLLSLRLALSLNLALALNLPLALNLALSPIRILILRLGRCARHHCNAQEQQKSQDCPSNIFDAVDFHLCNDLRADAWQ